MLYRMTRLGVDGMGIFALALVVEITVVATGGHRLVCEVEDGLQFITLLQWVVGGFGDANFPRHALLADAMSNHLATNLYHIVGDAFLL